MSINLNNYEEYFLLYIDNELSQQERMEVKAFLELHPQLNEEFHAFQITVQSPEEGINLLDKSFLLKNESSSCIDQNNFEEYFVAYHDNELNPQEQEEVENFITGSPNFKTDFELIKKTKLVADETIIFPNKKLLYKKEAGKVVPMIMWRALAAAVFTGFGLWFFISYSNQKVEIPPIIVAKNVEKTGAPNSSLIAKSNKVLQPEKVISPATSILEKETITQNNSNNKIKVIQVSNSEENGNENLVKNETLPLTQRLPQQKNEIPFSEITNKEIAINPLEIEKRVMVEAPSETFQNVNPVKESNSSSYAKQASFIVDEKEKSNDYIFYDTPSQDFSRTKVGGFLKKMKRMIVRGNPITQLFAGDDKQVASN